LVVWVCRAAVVAVVAIVYARTLHWGLYLDDQHHARPWTLHEVLGTFHGPFDPLGIEPVYYRPLVVVTFAADWSVWGYGTSGYHFTNIVLHALAALAVLELLRRTTVRWWAALAGAVLFAVIPANVATVVYISERSDAMVAIFTIVAMLALHRYARDRRVRWLVVTNVAFVLAVGAKEVGIATVLLAALYWWYLNIPAAPTGRPVSVAAHWRAELGRFWSGLVRRDGRRDWLRVVGSMGTVTVAYIVFRAIVLPNGALGESYSTSAGPVRGLASGLYHTFKGMPWEVHGWSVPFLVLLGVLALLAGPTSKHWREVLLGLGWVFGCAIALARLGQIEPRLLYVSQIGVAISFAGILGVIAEAVTVHRRAAVRRAVAVAVAAILLLVPFVAITSVSNIRAQDVFEPGSPKMLGADLRIWTEPDLHDRFPAHWVAVIEQRLRAAGLIG